jgi:hypothetical protein
MSDKKQLPTRRRRKFVQYMRNGKELLTMFLFFGTVFAVLSGAIYVISFLIARYGLNAIFWVRVAFWATVVCLFVGVVVLRKILRRAKYRKAVAKGMDFGIEEGDLAIVGDFLDKHGKRTSARKGKPINTAPQFAMFAAEYSSVKGKDGLLFSRKLFHELVIEDNCGNRYHCFSGRDDMPHYCIMESESDERIFRLELEMSSDPYPYASDIYQYFAIRMKNQEGF